ncbi:MAG TPA: hypothetical protein VMD79_04525 [Solirubrobacteraceae bacterium]|nr:hypothetical protein [Solirubrobacteraceae bacterium]
MTDEIKHPPSALIGEAASLFHLLGGMAAKHLVIVGGLVPPLLVPEAADTHIGSADIDLCLSLAITTGATHEYYQSIEGLLDPYFELERASGFRWRKKESAPGLPLILDFLAPAAEDDTLLADGTRALDEMTAAQNAGPRLRPFPIRSGELVDEDALLSTLEGVQLVYRSGARADVRIRYAGPVGFLAAKADALAGRNDSKDGYDVSWWCLNAKSSGAEVAALVTERPAFNQELFQESVAQLHAAFRAPDYPGPDGYAREEHPDLQPGDEEYEQARNAAYTVVSEVIEILKKHLW